MSRQARRRMASLRHPWRPIASSLMLAAALAVSGCTAGGSPQPSTAAGATSAPPLSGSPQATAPLETSQTSAKSPVYWLGRSRDSVYLFREFRDTGGPDNPMVRALRLMMSEKPLDPDYFSPWQSPKKLAASISGRNYITVDVSSDAFNSNVDEPTAQLAVQQLVYTATAAAASAGLIDAGQPISVMLLVDGRTSQVAFGRVQLGQLMQRDASMAAPAWIIDPQEGTSAKGPLKVFGRSTAPGSQLAWQILKKGAEGGKSVYLSGTVGTSTTPGTLGELTFTVNLEAGDYEVRLLPTEGADAPASSGTSAWDSKSFRIEP